MNRSERCYDDVTNTLPANTYYVAGAYESANESEIVALASLLLTASEEAAKEKTRLRFNEAVFSQAQKTASFSDQHYYLRVGTGLGYDVFIERNAGDDRHARLQWNYGWIIQGQLQADACTAAWGSAS